jgi:hypothetical protein
VAGRSRIFRASQRPQSRRRVRPLLQELDGRRDDEKKAMPIQKMSL